MRPFVAFDTATDHLAIGVGDLDDPASVVAQVDFPAPRAANTALLSAVDGLLADSGIGPADLEAVACGLGPGSFTGVRIGVATAKGVAHARRVPLVGFGTLDSIAWRAYRVGQVSPGALVGVVGDAMRGEVYPALFRVAENGVTRLGSHRVMQPHQVAQEWAALDERIALTGPGLSKHGAAFEGALGVRARMMDPRWWAPDGAGLVAAAWAATGDGTISAIAGLAPAEAYQVAHPGMLLPVYTRLSDAEEAERTRGGHGAPSSGVAGPPGGGAR